MRYPSFLSIGAFIMLLSLGCNTSKDASKSTVTDIPGKVMVLLDKSVQPQKLERDLSAYSLKSEGQISRAEYRFSYTFNTSKISADKLIKEINALPYASEATIPQQVKE